MSDVPDILVENRNQHAKALHRQHSGHESPRPACRERMREAPFHWVETDRLLPFRTLCQEPECFGEPKNNRGPTDARTCPKCGQYDRARNVIEPGRAMVVPCGCEIRLPSVADGGESDE